MYIIVMIMVIAAGVTLGIRQLLAPPRTTPDFTSSRPEIAEDGFITHTESVVIDMPLDRYVAWVVMQPLEAGLTGSDGVPSVMSTKSSAIRCGALPTMHASPPIMPSASLCRKKLTAKRISHGRTPSTSVRL